MQNYHDARVAFACKLMLSVMVNHYALSQILSNIDFTKLWKKLTPLDWATVQEMKAVPLAIGEHAVGEAHQSVAFKLSLKPHYHLALLCVANRHAFKVAYLGRQMKGMIQRDVPRKNRKGEDFTPAGKFYLIRIQKQTEKRLSAPKPDQCLATLIDPATT